MLKFTPLYEFTVTEPIEKDVTSTTTVDGKEVKTTTKEKTDSPVKILFKKPGRRDEEEGELLYSRKMNEFINKHGLMTRAMLANKYRDSGGLVSEETTKELAKVYKRWLEINEEIPLLKATKKSKKQKEKVEELEAELVQIQKQIIDLDSYKDSLLDQTADTKAQNELLRWYALNFFYIQREDDVEPVPYFEGKDYESKLEDYFAKEDSGDDLYKKVGPKIGRAAGIWFYHKLKDEKEFAALVEQSEKIG